jgi:hypothetical protein
MEQMQLMLPQLKIKEHVDLVGLSLVLLRFNPITFGNTKFIWTYLNNRWSIVYPLFSPVIWGAEEVF